MESNYERLAKDGAKIGGTAALASLVGELVMRRTNLGFGARGGAQGAVFILMSFLAAKTLPNVALGLFAAGLIQITRGAAQEYELRQFLAQQGAARGAVGSGSSGAATAGSGANSAGAAALGGSGGAIGPGTYVDPTASLFDRVVANARMRR